jgi:hypothetical protein
LNLLLEHGSGESLGLEQEVGSTPLPLKRGGGGPMGLPRTSEDWSLSEYVHSDYMNDSERETEADIPVPDRLLPKQRYRELVERLRLSQKIGLLLWLNREGLLTIGGRERLLYLQAKASFEALEAGLKFARRLSTEQKLQSDFRHQMRELNRRPQSKHFRQTQQRRIGVGYRDKGMLPDPSQRARRGAQEDSFLRAETLPKKILEILTGHLPQSLTEDGEWVDLSVLLRAFGSESGQRLETLLRPL